MNETPKIKVPLGRTDGRVPYFPFGMPVDLDDLPEVYLTAVYAQTRHKIVHVVFDQADRCRSVEADYSRKKFETSLTVPEMRDIVRARFGNTVRVPVISRTEQPYAEGQPIGDPPETSA